MTREARVKSKSGIYHILLRGINRQNIFENDDDYEKFIDILTTYKKTIGYEIYAYCLMNNHIHLLIKEGKEDISKTMQRIGISYVYWYNWQHGRKGHLFQDRFKSEAVENNHYLLTVLRYIHQHPLKIDLVNRLDNYQWSSYNEYLKVNDLTDVNYILTIFATDRIKAIQEFIRFNHEKTQDDDCLDMAKEKPKTKSDKDIRKAVLIKYKFDLTKLINQTPETQNQVLKYMKQMEGVSLRQIVRLTGFTLNKVYKA